MPRSYQEIIRLVQNGDPVDSSLNIILRQLAGNSDYLKSLLDEALLGQAVIAREVTVDADVQVGQPVYFNSTNQRLERAQAAATVSEEGQLVTADSTQVWGVCYYKHNSTKADVLLYGYATVDVTASITGTAAGLYFLSATSPGKLVLQQPPVTVPVLYWDGEGKVYVNPNFNNAFLQHQHYKFELQAVPAGTNVIVPEGSPHAIAAENTAVEGWLPANSEYFGGRQPEGAKFGYNIPVSSLNNVWPPLPLNGACVSWVRTIPSADNSNVLVPTINIAYFTSAISDTVLAEDTYDLVVDLSFNSAGFTTGDDVVIDFNSEIFTDIGLTINAVVISGNDEITITLGNATVSDIEFTDNFGISVTSTTALTLNLGGDFKEDTVPSDIVLIDANGIWWMTDCYGMVPWPVLYGEEEAAPTPAATVFTATARGVTRKDTSETYATAYGVTSWGALDVAVDTSNHKAYYTVTSGNIYSTSTDTTDASPEAVLYVDSPHGLDLDLTNGYIYYTESINGSIRRCDLDGQNDAEILSGLSSVGGIRLDATNDLLYFVDGAKIRKCGVDGTGAADVVTGLNTPRFLALDVSGNKLYWTDSGSNKVTRSTLTGTSITDLITSVDAVGIDIDVTNSFLYFSTASDTQLWRATIAGASVTSLVTFESWDAPSGVRYASMVAAKSSAPCADVPMQLTCWFTKMQFQSATTVVTSLRAVADSGLVITCVQDDSAAVVGDLQIDFDPEFLVDTNENTAGHIVIKEYTNKTFKRGPVVEALIVDSDFILAEATDENGNLLQGTVTLSFTPTPTGTELPIENVRLNNVEEEFYEDVLGLGFRQDIDSEYRAKVNVPSTIEATTVRIRLRFLVLARAAGDIPALTLTARTVPRPGATTATALALPTTDSAVTLSVADADGMAEDDYIELVSAEINTTPGAFVLFTLSRAGSSDSFAGDLHVIDQRAVVSSIT